MADDMEKTEEPSAKKIEDAKKEGNVPRSMDTNSFVTLIVAVIAVASLFFFINSRIEKLFVYYLSFIGSELTKNSIFLLGVHSLKELVFMIIPIAVMVAIAGIIAGLMQFGLIFTTKPITPDLKKIDPIKGFKKLFSMKTFIEGIKIIIKVSIVFVIAFFFLVEFTKELAEVISYDIISQLVWLRDKAIVLVAVMLLLFFVISIIDLLIVRFQYFKDLRMSKQEVKDEYKQMEGDPMVKSRIKKIQMELAQKRMMQNIPSADVIITNPTHYAVAIRYDKTKENAPKIVAKGVDYLALKIKEIAREHLIQIVENPPLARELYKVCEVDDEIPENLYKAVAEVLAFVYKAKGTQPST